MNKEHIEGLAKWAEAERMQEVADTLRDLWAVVSRLPRTVDGVRVVPGDMVYSVGPDHPTCLAVQVGPEGQAGFYPSDEDTTSGVYDFEPILSVCACYSTREAAEKAAQL